MGLRSGVHAPTAHTVSAVITIRAPGLTAFSPSGNDGSLADSDRPLPGRAAGCCGSEGGHQKPSLFLFGMFV